MFCISTRAVCRAISCVSGASCTLNAMTYHYDFRLSTRRKIRAYSRELHNSPGGFGVLRDELDAWNRRALEHGAVATSIRAAVLRDDWNFCNRGHALDENRFYPYSLCGWACIEHFRVWCQIPGFIMRIRIASCCKRRRSAQRPALPTVLATAVIRL